MGIDSGGGVGQQLVEGVDAERLRAGAAEEHRGRGDLIGSLLGGDGAFVAVTEGFGEGPAGGIEADVIHGPAIDGDGGYAFGGRCGCLAQTLFQAGQDGFQRPAKRCAAMHGSVGKAMDEFDGGLAALPAQQGETAAFRAQVDGNAGRFLQAGRRFHDAVHRRSSSDSVISDSGVTTRWRT